jgi:PAS domain S-box-containing protein
MRPQSRTLSMAAPDPTPRDPLEILEVVLHLAEAVAEAEDVEQVYTESLKALERVLEADRSAVLLLDGDGVMRFKAWQGLSEDYRRAVEGHSPWRPDEPDPQPVLIEDAAKDPSLAPLRDTVLAEGIRALAFLPIRYRERLLGKFMIYFDRPHRFTEGEVVVGRAVAAQIAFAIGRLDADTRLRDSREQLELILEGVSDGITVQDHSGALLYANEAAANVAGFPSAQALRDAPREQIVGAFEIVDETGAPLTDDRLPGRRALLGERVDDVLLGFRSPQDRGLRWSLVSAVPIRDAAGGVRFAVNIFREVTDRLRAQRAQEILVEAGHILASSLDYETTLANVAHLAVPTLADWCIVDILEGGTIRQLAVAHRDPDKDEWIRELRRRFPPDWSRPHPITRVLATGRAEFATDLASEGLPLTSDDPENRRLLGDLGSVSHLVVPLVAGGETLGAISLVHGESGRRFTEEDLPLAEELAGRAASAVNHARLYRQARESGDRLAFLAEASELLASSLDYETTLARLAELAVPRLADWCGVEVLEEDEIRQLALAHVDPEKVELARRFRERYPPDPNALAGVPEVIRTGRPELYPEITDELLRATARDAEQLELLRTLQMRSIMVVPLTARGRTLGALTLISAEPGRRYDGADLAYAEDLARRAAFAVDNARLFRDQSQVARTLQASLLPPSLPEIPGVEAAARYYPAGHGVDVGGDFYDLFQTGPDRWWVVIGDVCGRGVEAAALTGLVRHTIRATALQGREPADVLRFLNDAILAEQHEVRFCTVALGKLELGPSGAGLELVCGGHPIPLLHRAGGEVVPAGHPGALLGVTPEPRLDPASVKLAPGDSLLLFTDGITERRAGSDLFGEERLRRLLASCGDRTADQMAQQIEQAVIRFGESDPRDDMALLVLRLTGP